MIISMIVYRSLTTISPKNPNEILLLNQLNAMFLRAPHWSNPVNTKERIYSTSVRCAPGGFACLNVETIEILAAKNGAVMGFIADLWLWVHELQ